MELEELRQMIDDVDDTIISLFQSRMNISAKIAEYKQRHNMPVYDPERERQKLHDLSKKVEEVHEAHISALFSLLFEISRTEQERILNSEAQ